MLTKTKFVVNKTLIKDSLLQVDNNNFKQTINVPTGDYFTDTWQIKEEFKNSVWEEMLQVLPNDYGEARIIVLPYGKCYQSHADIDDRYHLTLQSHYSYIIDIDNKMMHELTVDGNWYIMDASNRHSATNFGLVNRIQFVVRKLLKNTKLDNPVWVKIYNTNLDPDYARFYFDDTLSGYLNFLFKNKYASNFKHDLDSVSFYIEKKFCDSLIKKIPNTFKYDTDE